MRILEIKSQDIQIGEERFIELIWLILIFGTICNLV